MPTKPSQPRSPEGPPAPAPASELPLSVAENSVDAYAESARARATLLYLGDAVAHRSCGIALAETFGLPPGSYQALRKGGLLGLGPCGAIQAGVLVLGELLGDPDPTGMPTPALKAAIPRYRALVAAAVDGSVEASCNARTAPFPEFASRARLEHCTSLAAIAAGAVATVLWEVGQIRPIPPAPTR